MIKSKNRKHLNLLCDIGELANINLLSEIKVDKEADFFSIGTNDLIQYLLAVDRTNEKVAAYYQPYHPSVLRSLHRIIQAAVTAEIEVTVCGEMGHKPEFIPFFIGIGLRAFSVDPYFLRSVQKKIINLSVSQAAAYAQALLIEPTLEGIQVLLSSQNKCNGQVITQIQYVNSITS